MGRFGMCSFMHHKLLQRLSANQRQLLQFNIYISKDYFNVILIESQKDYINVILIKFQYAYDYTY